MHDLIIADDCTPLDMLAPGEIIMGDKGYIGRDHLFLCPVKSPSTEIDKQFNSALSKHRIIVENSIGRVKKMGIVKQEWRHAHADHAQIFFLLCKIANLDITINPLRL